LWEVLRLSKVVLGLLVLLLLLLMRVLVRAVVVLLLVLMQRLSRLLRHHRPARGLGGRGRACGRV